MIPREAITSLKSLAEDYPVVSIIGPRQVGKTTLARTLFPDKPYVNLEAPDERDFALNDPKRFLSRFPEGAILDEIQYVPHLTSYIQVIVDEVQTHGMFILTGSQQIDFGQTMVQSLAGRVGIFKLSGLSIAELKQANINLTLDELLCTGFMPRLYSKPTDAKTYYANYINTYLEKDLRNLSQIHNLSLFQRFLTLLASRVGNLINYNNLANEVGVSAPTIEHWLSILEASYLIFRLPPYFENFGKRVTKTPKIYFFDVGLVSYLLGIENTTQMMRDPLRGHLVENLIVLECMKTKFNQGQDAKLYFFRDSHQHEIDLIYKHAHSLIPIEIKAAESLSKHFIKPLQYFKKLTPDRVPMCYLVYAGEHEYALEDVQLIRYDNVPAIFEAIDAL